MKPTIIFRVDGANIYSIAMGHAYRCMRLASVLQEKGSECLFFMKNYPEGINLIKSAGFSIITMPIGITDQEEAELVVSHARSVKAAIFIDLRTGNKQLVELARAHHLITIIYDDVKGEELAATVLINPSEGCKNLYGAEGTRYLLGNDYVILDPDLVSYRRNFFVSKIGRLFVCFGGADPCNLSSRVLESLLDRQGEILIDIAIGPAFRHNEHIEQILGSYSGCRSINIIRGCNRLAPLMSLADAAITSGGTIIYEAIAMNLPTLALPSIEHEADIVSLLMDRHLTMGLRMDTAKVDREELNVVINRFIDDAEERNRCYQAQDIADLSQGTKLVADAILSLIYEQSNQIKNL